MSLLEVDDDVHGVSLDSMIIQIEEMRKSVDISRMAIEDRENCLLRQSEQTEEIEDVYGGSLLDADFYKAQVILCRMERRRLPGFVSEHGEEEEEFEGSSDKENIASPERASRQYRVSGTDAMEDVQDSGVFLTSDVFRQKATPPPGAQGVGISGDADNDEHGWQPDATYSMHKQYHSPYPYHNELLPDTQFAPSPLSDRLPNYSPTRYHSDAANLHQPADPINTEPTTAVPFSPHKPGHPVAKNPPIGVPDYPDASNSLLATRALGIMEFTRLRAKPVATNPTPSPERTVEVVSVVQPSIIEPQVIPPEVIDHQTFQLPSDLMLPEYIHRYMASLELVQKQGLTRLLCSPECAIDLIEREDLDGVDLILDPDTAVVILNISFLPTGCLELVERLSAQSWRYRHILLLLEAFTPALAFRSENDTRRLQLSAYSPPVLKAIKKLRRDISLAEGFGNKSSSCDILIGFPSDVRETALLTRYYGDLAHARALDLNSGGSILWDDRGWLDGDASSVSSLVHGDKFLLNALSMKTTYRSCLASIDLLPMSYYAKVALTDCWIYTQRIVRKRMAPLWVLRDW